MAFSLATRHHHLLCPNFATTLSKPPTTNPIPRYPTYHATASCYIMIPTTSSMFVDPTEWYPQSDGQFHPDSHSDQVFFASLTENSGTYSVPPPWNPPTKAHFNTQRFSSSIAAESSTLHPPLDDNPIPTSVAGVHSQRFSGAGSGTLHPRDMDEHQFEAWFLAPTTVQSNVDVAPVVEARSKAAPAVGDMDDDEFEAWFLAPATGAPLGAPKEGIGRSHVVPGRANDTSRFEGQAVELTFLEQDRVGRGDGFYPASVQANIVWSPEGQAFPAAPSVSSGMGFTLLEQRQVGRRRSNPASVQANAVSCYKGQAFPVISTNSRGMEPTFFDQAQAYAQQSDEPPHLGVGMGRGTRRVPEDLCGDVWRHGQRRVHTRKAEEEVESQWIDGQTQSVPQMTMPSLNPTVGHNDQRQMIPYQVDELTRSSQFGGQGFLEEFSQGIAQTEHVGLQIWDGGSRGDLETQWDPNHDLSPTLSVPSGIPRQDRQADDFTMMQSLPSSSAIGLHSQSSPLSTPRSTRNEEGDGDIATDVGGIRDEDDHQSEQNSTAKLAWKRKKGSSKPTRANFGPKREINPQLYVSLSLKAWRRSRSNADLRKCKGCNNTKRHSPKNFHSACTMYCLVCETAPYDIPNPIEKHKCLLYLYQKAQQLKIRFFGCFICGTFDTSAFRKGQHRCNTCLPIAADYKRRYLVGEGLVNPRPTSYGRHSRQSKNNSGKERASNEAQPTHSLSKEEEIDASSVEGTSTTISDAFQVWVKAIEGLGSQAARSVNEERRQQGSAATEVPSLRDPTIPWTGQEICSAEADSMLLLLIQSRTISSQDQYQGNKKTIPRNQPVNSPAHRKQINPAVYLRTPAEASWDSGKDRICGACNLQFPCSGEFFHHIKARYCIACELEPHKHESRRVRANIAMSLGTRAKGMGMLLYGCKYCGTYQKSAFKDKQETCEACK